MNQQVAPCLRSLDGHIRANVLEVAAHHPVGGLEAVDPSLGQTVGALQRLVTLQPTLHGILDTQPRGHGKVAADRLANRLDDLEEEAAAPLGVATPAVVAGVGVR